jgi:hypothetical protein
MKAKKLNGKLRLNKKTVADLTRYKMAGIKGGLITVQFTCFLICDTELTCDDRSVCGECWTKAPTICPGPGC